MIRSILLIEDDDSQAELIRRLLVREPRPPSRIDRASTLSEGLRKIEEDEPDAVLLDLGLPDSPRDETLAILVASAPHIPLIVLTAQDDANELGAKAVSEGADDYIFKSETNGASILRAVRYSIERKRAVMERLRYAEELEQSNQALRQFSHLVAHELKQPLNPIRLNCAVLRRELGEASKTVYSCIEDIESAVREMGRLVNDMLAFSEVSRLRTPRSIVHTRSMLDGILIKFSEEIAKGGVQVEVGTLPSIQAHETLLRQLFLNLIQNALLYGAGSPPRIEIGSEDRGTRWRFTLRDNGPGIAKADHARAFEMFTRLGSSSNRRGSGIGLALCRLIVEHHGGTIGLESEVGSGCKVWFDLPKPNEDPDA